MRTKEVLCEIFKEKTTEKIIPPFNRPPIVLITCWLILINCGGYHPPAWLTTQHGFRTSTPIHHLTCAKQSKISGPTVGFCQSAVKTLQRHITANEKINGKEEASVISLLIKTNSPTTLSTNHCKTCRKVTNSTSMA